MGGVALRSWLEQVLSSTEPPVWLPHPQKGRDTWHWRPWTAVATVVRMGAWEGVCCPGPWCQATGSQREGISREEESGQPCADSCEPEAGQGRWTESSCSGQWWPRWGQPAKPIPRLVVQADGVQG